MYHQAHHSMLIGERLCLVYIHDCVVLLQLVHIRITAMIFETEDGANLTKLKCNLIK